jgi:Zn-dependent M28 family amino/carboxypeptidase
LFAGTGHTAHELLATARAGEPLPRFDMAVRIRARTRVVKTSVESANLIAKLEGSDPKLKHEYVLLSAHIDHLGLRDPVNGDAIYNGAIDNASGVAVLLDIAAQLNTENTRPRRSVLFAFFTAEEGGLLGSKYFVAHSTVDSRSIVANINVDNVQAVVPLKAIEVLGMDASDIGDAVRRVVAAQGLALDVDERLGNSDHLTFIEHGIPAVKVNVGFLGEMVAIQEQWRRERYHTPFDDLLQPVDLESAAKYEQFVSGLLLDIANNPRRPAWKANSFYRRYAAH